MRRIILFSLFAFHLSLITSIAQEPTEHPLFQKYKTFSVIGDSYSTFVGKTEPVDNAQFYPREGIDIYEPSQTWWMLFQRETGIQLEQNNSYSGGTICNTWWNGEDASAVSFVARCKNLRGADIIIVEGATNDNNANSPMGSYVYADWTVADLKAFRPATAYVLNYLQQKYPDALVVFMLNNGLRTDINESVEQICQHYNVPLLRLANVSKALEHPTYTGMRAIKNQLVKLLLEVEEE